jgi:hypothetical protein
MAAIADRQTMVAPRDLREKVVIMDIPRYGRVPGASWLEMW